MMPTPPSPVADHASPCEHCGRVAALNELYLCPACAGRPTVVRLYAGALNRPDGWADHLKRLAERAARRVPLFDDVPP